MFFFYANQKGDDKNEMIDDVSKNPVIAAMILKQFPI